MGLACFLIVLANSGSRDRLIVGIYATVTTLVGLAFVFAGRTPGKLAPTVTEKITGEPVSLVEE